MDNARGNVYKAVVPACSISEEEGLVVVKAELPGVGKDGLEIKIEGNTLAIEGSREAEAPTGAYLLRERRTGPYRKSFTIDDSIDRDRVEAELSEGMLTLKLHVKEAAKPRRITIL